MSLVTGADREIARHEAVKFNLHRIFAGRRLSWQKLQADALRITVGVSLGSPTLMSVQELLCSALLLNDYTTSRFTATQFGSFANCSQQSNLRALSQNSGRSLDTPTVVVPRDGTLLVSREIFRVWCLLQ